MAIEGFTQSRIETNGIEVSVHQAGRGEPLILLHGYPQNHMCWAKIAPRLAERFHVIVPDLRGYGASDAPQTDPENRTYSKREMAKDIVGLMDALSIERAHVLGHDRGARVTYRLALDHPQRIARIGIIEIVPTGDFWAAWNAELAMKAYHWTFLAQPSPLPERMILSDGPGYIDWTLASWTVACDLAPFAPDALDSYRAQGGDPVRVAAMCNDYRAGATIDRAIDDEDRAAGRQIAAPLHFVWSDHGFPSRTGNPLDLWRSWAPHVTGSEIADCGHFAMEEAPDAVLSAVLPHFTAAG
ncbi:alpha/beta hydrolase [Maritalea mobilis]|uniref:alpha/beta fold hydrolase n=1 Tax=Maritalea mobilis TaxID=483324 RepID=UPI001C97D902|nr:alpha/beta hydrolase [Maritalea mobilis]MBY6203005.1 alpha/beta hydrolase [Maritalea mobilis]